MEKDLIQIQKVLQKQKNNELKLIDIYIYLDEKRRRIVLCLKALKPELEKTTISSIYYYLKSKSSTMVNKFYSK